MKLSSSPDLFSLWHRNRFSFRLLLVDVGLGHADGESTNAGDDSYSLGDADGSARIENVEQMRALQAEVESGEDWEAFTLFAFRYSLFSRIGLFAVRFSVIAGFGRLTLLHEVGVVLVQ